MDDIRREICQQFRFTKRLSEACRLHRRSVESQSFNSGKLFMVVDVRRRQSTTGSVSSQQAFPGDIDRIAEGRDQSHARHEHIIGTGFRSG